MNEKSQTHVMHISPVSWMAGLICIQMATHFVNMAPVLANHSTGICIYTNLLNMMARDMPAERTEDCG